MLSIWYQLFYQMFINCLLKPHCMFFSIIDNICVLLAYMCGYLLCNTGNIDVYRLLYTLGERPTSRRRMPKVLA